MELNIARNLLLYICIQYTCRCNMVISSAVPTDSDSTSTENIYGDGTELSSLKDLLYQMKHQLENVTKENAGLKNRLEKIEQRSLPQSDFNQASRTIFLDVVGFTVQLGNTIHDLPVGSTVLFDEVWYNAGNGYDKSTGIFTCPQSGVYLFAIFVESDNTDSAEITIYVDGSHRISAVSQRYQDGFDSTGGNIIVEHIQKGQRVWVETHYFDNQDLFQHFTSFSGVLIKST